MKTVVFFGVFFAVRFWLDNVFEKYTGHKYDIASFYYGMGTIFLSYILSAVISPSRNRTPGCAATGPTPRSESLS